MTDISRVNTGVGRYEQLIIAGWNVAKQQVSLPYLCINKKLANSKYNGSICDVTLW